MDYSFLDKPSSSFYPNPTKLTHKTAAFAIGSSASDRAKRVREGMEALTEAIVAEAANIPGDQPVVLIHVQLNGTDLPKWLLLP